MIELAITFGSQYAHRHHERTAGRAHPDGYWVIEADDPHTARVAAFDRLGEAWAFDYELRSGAFQADIARYYPRGELGRTRVVRTWMVGDVVYVATEDVEPQGEPTGRPATWGVDSFDDYPEGSGS